MVTKIFFIGLTILTLMSSLVEPLTNILKEPKTNINNLSYSKILESLSLEDYINDEVVIKSIINPVDKYTWLKRVNNDEVFGYKLYSLKDKKLKEALEILESDKEIDRVELNLIPQANYSPSDPMFKRGFGTDYTRQNPQFAQDSFNSDETGINLPKVWSFLEQHHNKQCSNIERFCGGSKDIKIGIIDSPIQANHPDFDLNHFDLRYQSEYPYLSDKTISNCVKVSKDYRVTCNTPSGQARYPYIDASHGTAVAGVIGAQPNGEGSVGVAYNTTLIPRKSSNLFALADSYRKLVDEAGAKVITQSSGWTTYSKLLHEAIKYAYDKNVVLLASLGNGGSEGFQYPSAFPEVFGIAAGSFTKNVDPNSFYHKYSLDITQYSNYGKSSGQDFSVTIQMREKSGESSYLPGPAAPCALIECFGFTNTPYDNFSGTSSATPIAAGIVAQMLSLNPILSIEQIRHILNTTAIDGGEPGYDNRNAAGTINMLEALKKSLNPPTVMNSDDISKLTYIDCPEAKRNVAVHCKLYSPKDSPINITKLRIHSSQSLTIGGESPVSSYCNWNGVKNMTAGDFKNKNYSKNFAEKFGNMNVYSCDNIISSKSSGIKRLHYNYLNRPRPSFQNIIVNNQEPDFGYLYETAVNCGMLIVNTTGICYFSVPSGKDLPEVMTIGFAGNTFKPCSLNLSATEYRCEVDANIKLGYQRLFFRYGTHVNLKLTQSRFLTYISDGKIFDLHNLDFKNLNNQSGRVIKRSNFTYNKYPNFYSQLDVPDFTTIKDVIKLYRKNEDGSYSFSSQIVKTKNFDGSQGRNLELKLTDSEVKELRESDMFEIYTQMELTFEEKYKIRVNNFKNVPAAKVQDYAPTPDQINTVSIRQITPIH